MSADRELPTILLVEDDRGLAKVLCRVLVRSGYRVEWAANVAEVREWTGEPALALIDLHLPDGDGVDVAELLRARYSALPMLLITGCPFHLRERPDDVQYFRQVLTKPLDLLQFREAISGLMKEDAHASYNAAHR